MEPALFARVFLFGKLLDDYLLAVMHIYALHRRPIPYVDLGASMCCAGLSLQQKKSPLPFAGRRGLVGPIRNRTLPLGNLPDRSVSEADDVDAALQSCQFLASDRIDADYLVPSRCLRLFDAVWVGCVGLLGDAEDGRYLARCRGGEGDAVRCSRCRCRA